MKWLLLCVLLFANTQAFGQTRLRDRVFMKVGDSISYTGHFLRSLGLGRYAQIGEPHASKLAATYFFFKQSIASDGHWNSYSHYSKATVIGARVWDPAGTSLMKQEFYILKPRIALIMFGTNDVAFNDLNKFKKAYATLLDWLLAKGVFPIVYTIPPREDQWYLFRRVDVYNDAIKQLARSRRVLLVDYYKVMLALPSHGLSTDRIHPSVCQGHGGWGSGVLTAKCLQYGYNMRNLLTLQALDKARRLLQLRR